MGVGKIYGTKRMILAWTICGLFLPRLVEELEAVLVGSKTETERVSLLRGQKHGLLRIITFLIYKF